MEPHVKNYLSYFGYDDITDFIPCECCGAQACDCHHIKFRSQLGDDTYTNVAALCRRCHDKCHGKLEPQISEEEMQTVHDLHIDRHNYFRDDL